MSRAKIELIQAESLVVGPDEVLVVVLPQNMTEFAEGLADTLRERLGDRFFVIAGTNATLAKVKR